MNNRFVWSEVDTGLFAVSRVGSAKPIGYVAHVRSGAWFARVGLSGDLFSVESEADGKAKVEAALMNPVEVAPLRHDAVADPARRNPNVARGLPNERGRVFASGLSR
jgi:hypothetical protein